MCGQGPRREEVQAALPVGCCQHQGTAKDTPRQAFEEALAGSKAEGE